MMIKQLLLLLISFLMKIFGVALWGYCILSWVAMANPNLYRIYQALSKYIEPILKPFQKILMPITMRTGIDFSPMLLAIVVPYIFRMLAIIIASL